MTMLATAPFATSSGLGRHNSGLMDKSYYAANSPDSSATDTSSSSNGGCRENGLRRYLSPAEDATSLCYDGDVNKATLAGFRRRELLRGRWVPFARTYLERLFDCALTEMNVTSSIGESRESECLTSSPSSSVSSVHFKRQVSHRPAVKSDIVQNDVENEHSLSMSKGVKRKLADRNSPLKPSLSNNEEPRQLTSSTAADKSVVRRDIESLPVVGPANNRWFVIEKEALLTCFEKALASEMRQTRAAVRLSPSSSSSEASTTAAVDERPYKHQARRQLQRVSNMNAVDVQQPPRPLSAPTLLMQSAVASPSSSQFVPETAEDESSRDSSCRDNEEEDSPSPPQVPFGDVISNSQPFPTNLPTVVFPHLAHQQQFLPSSFSHLFAAAAAAEAAFLANVRNHQLMSLGSSVGVGGLYDSSLPYLLSFHHNPYVFDSLAANLRHLQEKISLAPLPNDSSCPLYPFTAASHCGLNPPAAADMAKSGPFADISRRSDKACKRRAEDAIGNSDDCVFSSDHCRRQKLADVSSDGWVALSKVKVNKMISDLLERDDPIPSSLTDQSKSTSTKSHTVLAVPEPDISKRLSAAPSSRPLQLSKKTFHSNALVEQPSVKAEGTSARVLGPVEDAENAVASQEVTSSSGECLKWKSRLLRRVSDNDQTLEDQSDDLYQVSTSFADSCRNKSSSGGLKLRSHKS